jgi:hypothetical protein
MNHPSVLLSVNFERRSILIASSHPEPLRCALCLRQPLAVARGRASLRGSGCWHGMQGSRKGLLLPKTLLIIYAAYYQNVSFYPRFIIVADPKNNCRSSG